MLNFREAIIDDLQLYFDWANDEAVRDNSYSPAKIDLESHSRWFSAKLEDKSCLLLIFQNEDCKNVGQIRIQKQDHKESIIGVSVDLEFRGKGYAKEMLQLASDYFLVLNPDFVINAFIKIDNLNSKYAVEKAGFEFTEFVDYEGISSFHYIKKRNENR